MLRFNESWLSEAQFTDWLVKVSNDESRAYCRWCAIVLRAHKTDLTSHAGTAKHNKNAMTASTTPQRQISVQIVPKGQGDKSMKQSSTPCFDEGTDFDEMGNSRGAGRSPYTKKYRTVWEHVPELKNWLTDYPPDISKAFCKVCQVQLRAHKHDLMIHARSTKHKKAEELYMSGISVRVGIENGGGHFMSANFPDTNDFPDEDQDQEDNSTMEADEDDDRLSDNADADNNGSVSNTKNGKDGKSLDAPVTRSSQSRNSLEPDTSQKSNSDADTEVSVIRVSGRPFHMRPLSRKRRQLIGVSDVIEAIERNDFTGYELLQIVKAAIPKL